MATNRFEWNRCIFRFKDHGCRNNFLSIVCLSKPTILSKRKNIMLASAGTASLNDYQFMPPARSYTYRNPNYILLSSSKGANYGCQLNIYPPQSSSGNLETDARNIFNQMYSGWQYRYS